MLIVGSWYLSAFVVSFWVAAESERCFHFFNICFITCEILNNLHYVLLDFAVSHVATNYTPRFNEVDRGYTGITLSVCPSVDRIVSALYLQEYSSDPFHICTSYQATSEGVSLVMPISKFKNLKFWRFFKICDFDYVFFWLGIQYDSMVWVIMRRRGVSSERRRSSCSSLDLNENVCFQYFGPFLMARILIWKK